jgi:alkylation response protein AidB-like acyl-CoA dehydrogenase
VYPVENLLGGTEGRGMQQVLSALETGRINIAARSVGIAQAAYDAAFTYSQEREAFGQPISQFQAIQLKLADMATELQAARLLTYWAASKMDRGERADLESAWPSCSPPRSPSTSRSSRCASTAGTATRRSSRSSALPRRAAHGDR